MMGHKILNDALCELVKGPYSLKYYYVINHNILGMIGLFTSDLDSGNNPRPYPSPFQAVATEGNYNDNILVFITV